MIHIFICCNLMNLNYQKSREAKLKKKNSLANKVVEFLLTCELDVFETLTIHKITEIFGISRSYLFKEFKNKKAFTLNDFINREKMLRAAALLEKNEKLTIKKISEKFGFCTSEYFIILFEKHFGITPGRYRQLKLKARHKKTASYDPHITQSIK